MSDKITTKQTEKGNRSNSATMSNGKLVDPAILTDYSKILPNAPERILSMTEDELRHRRWLEKTALIGNLIIAHLGIVFAAILTLCFLVGGVICIMYDHDLAGGALISSALVSIVTAFIYGTRNR